MPNCIMEEANAIESITIVFKSQTLPEMDIQVWQNNDQVIDHFTLQKNTSHTIMNERDIEDCYFSASNKAASIENHFYIRIENIVADNKGHYKIVKKFQGFQLHVEIMLKGFIEEEKKHIFDEQVEVNIVRLAHRTLMKIQEKVIKKYELEEMKKEMVISKKTKKGKKKLKGSVLGFQSSKKKIKDNINYKSLSKESGLSSILKDESKISALLNPNYKLKNRKNSTKTNKSLRFNLTQHQNTSDQRPSQMYSQLRLKKYSTSYSAQCQDLDKLCQTTNQIDNSVESDSLERESQNQSLYAVKLKKIQGIMTAKAKKINEVIRIPPLKNRMQYLEQITAIELIEQEKILKVLRDEEDQKQNKKKGSQSPPTTNTKAVIYQTTTSPYSLKLSTYFKHNRFLHF